jgi:MFS family permease
VLVLAISVGLGSLFTLLSPVLAQLHWTGLFVCCIAVGFAYGMFFAAEIGLWAYWAGLSERSRMIGIAHSGQRAGNILALPLGGVLCLQGYRQIYFKRIYKFLCNRL